MGIKAKMLKTASFNHETGVLMHVMHHTNIKAHSSVRENDRHAQVYELQYAKQQLPLICKTALLLLKIYYSLSSLHIQLLNELCLIPTTPKKNILMEKKKLDGSN